MVNGSGAHKEILKMHVVLDGFYYTGLFAMNLIKELKQ